MEFLLEHRLVVDARSEARERAGMPVLRMVGFRYPQIRGRRWRGKSGRSATESMQSICECTTLATQTFSGHARGMERFAPP